MKRLLIEEIKNHVGEQVRIEGFAQTIRDQGKITFIIIRDRTGTVQTVVWNEAPEALATAKDLSHESVVRVIGLVKEERQAPGGFEVTVQQLQILSKASPELPIPVIGKIDAETDQSVRLDWRWLDLRKPEKLLVYKVWTEMEAAFQDYCRNNSYLQIHSPKIMSTPSESGAELFEVQYFDRKAYLAQSPQFYKQMAMAAGLERVFEVGPVFRAEPSYTTRHATEFTGYDAEISYIESHQDIMREHENALVDIFKKISGKYGKEIKELYGQDLSIPTAPFPQVTMNEAKQLLQSAGVLSERDGDLSPEEERKLSEIIKEREGHDFVFVTEYPVSVRPFYHMRHDTDPSVTKSFDLLYRGIEITTGAQREHRYEVLCRQAEEKGMSIQSIQHYLDFFKYGCPPHGGYGHGPERLLMKIFGVESIREISFIYRGVKRLTP